MIRPSTLRTGQSERKSTALRHFAQKLLDATAARSFDAELPHWTEALAPERTRSLSPDFPARDGYGTFGTTNTLTQTLTREQTARFLGCDARVPRTKAPR